jgi:hypothetical protein
MVSCGAVIPRYVINNLGPGGGQVVEETHQIGKGIQLFFEPTNYFPTIDQNIDNAIYLNMRMNLHTYILKPLI